MITAKVVGGIQRSLLHDHRNGGWGTQRSLLHDHREVWCAYQGAAA
jgi:hypothetical protein